jgi:hypothetical protein
VSFGAGGLRVALLSAPEAILTPDGGAMELANGGDPATTAMILRRLAEQFGAVFKDRYYRNLFGDTEREREYWWLDIGGHRYMVLRCTAPEAPPGICVAGPIGTPEELSLFRAVAASFGAVVRDRRPPASRPWWRLW